MAKLFEKLIRPVLFRMDPETAHEMAIGLLEKGLSTAVARRAAAAKFATDFPYPLKRCGLEFRNPLGIAAGFDKNGRVVNQLSSLGFGFVEVGTVTLRPQPGNDKPRMFRLPADMALINRLGFNNDGAEAVVRRLSDLRRECIVGVNIGKNKDVPNEEAVENYRAVLELVHPAADYISVNISSPNTPNLRDLQRPESLDDLLDSLQRRNQELGARPLLVKIAPDLSDGEIAEAVDICKQHEVDGIIATNTTVSRDGLKTRNVEAIGAGGLSGRPLSSRSTAVISQIYRIADGKLPIIGVGGIFTPRDAFDKITAGASLLQAYTGFVYSGPRFASDINTGLAELLDKERFSAFDEAVGSRAA